MALRRYGRNVAIDDQRHTLLQNRVTKFLRLSVENHVLASIFTLTPDLSLEWLSLFMFLYD